MCTLPFLTVEEGKLFMSTDIDLPHSFKWVHSIEVFHNLVLLLMDIYTVSLFMKLLY
jgi:hypothetical protein